MSKKILVVDDSETVRQHVGFTLQDAGFEVVEAEDGEDGISKLASHPDVTLVICDVNMPRLTGIEMLERLSQAAALPPTVMLTTEDSIELIKKAKALGAKGWLVKPVKPEQLVAVARKLGA